MRLCERNLDAWPDGLNYKYGSQLLKWPCLFPPRLGDEGGWIQLTSPAGVETEPREGRDLVSFCTVCPASRMMLGVPSVRDQFVFLMKKWT